MRASPDDKRKHARLAEDGGEPHIVIDEELGDRTGYPPQNVDEFSPDLYPELPKNQEESYGYSDTGDAVRRVGENVRLLPIYSQYPSVR